MKLRPTLAGAIAGIAIAASPGLALDLLALAEVAAAPATRAEMSIEASNDLPIHGFSLAISWQEAQADLESIGIDGTAVAALEPDFVQAIIDPSQRAAILAVIVELAPPFLLREIEPAEELRPIAKARFLLPARARPGRHPVRFADGIRIGGAGELVRNIFSSAGRSIAPALRDGAFIVENPNRVRIGEVRIRAGGFGDSIVRATHPEPLQGYEIAVVYPSGPLALASIGVDGLDVERLVGRRGADGGIEFVHPRIMDPILPGLGWGGIAVQFDALEPFAGQTLRGGEEQSIARFRFRAAIDAEPGARFPIEPRDGYGVPPLGNAFLIDGRAHLPDVEPGTAIVEEAARFVRGDGNGDGIVNIADPIHGLSYLFASGPADCRDAIDANDDGEIDIADPIFTLNYIFSDGDAPPPPFPAPGGDPTPDLLDCDR